jgi:hypothetical protein
MAQTSSRTRALKRIKYLRDVHRLNVPGINTPPFY